MEMDRTITEDLCNKLLDTLIEKGVDVESALLAVDVLDTQEQGLEMLSIVNELTELDRRGALSLAVVIVDPD